MSPDPALAPALASINKRIDQGDTFQAALDCLYEAEEILIYEAYEKAAAELHPSNAVDDTADDTVVIRDDGAWVAMRVWIPKSAIGLN